MRFVLCTLVLNEMEHLARLYRQHKDWPGLGKWVFVEAADIVYGQTNPELVTEKGLSIDGTSEFLTDLAKQDDRVIYLPYGWTKHPDPAQGKVPARQAYLDCAEKIKPDFVFVLDADEYYCHAHQQAISRVFEVDLYHHAFTFLQRHIWYPASLAGKPLCSYEVTGGYWSVPHTRGWRWLEGMRYSTNHNTPEDAQGRSLAATTRRVDKERDSPYCVHLGFASAVAGRHAKHAYYVARGEGTTDRRQWYVDCRSAFETWTPGEILPHGARVTPYMGIVPEVLRL